jgi:hypothetical protein
VNYLNHILAGLILIWALIGHFQVKSLQEKIQERDVRERILIEHTRDIDQIIHDIRTRRTIEDSLRAKPNPKHEEQIRLIRAADNRDLERIIRMQIADSARFHLLFKAGGSAY